MSALVEKADDDDDDEVEKRIEELSLQESDDVLAESSAREIEAVDIVRTAEEESAAFRTPIDFSNPVTVIYCPHCTFPPEYCEFGPYYAEKCLPWITEHCPELLPEEDDDVIHPMTL